MKKVISFILTTLLLLFSVGCEMKQTPKKLVEIERYAGMRIDGTTSIDVVYDYVEGDFFTYEFTIENQEIIGNIMAEVFNVELKEYPDDQDIDFYQRWIIVHQGDNEYHINLCYNSDESGNRYLYQSHGLFDIIEKYIEDNLID